MRTYKIIKLTNLSPIHVGTGKENYDFSSSVLHSDTLMAALAAIKARLDDSDDIASFLNSFALSSAFPFCGKQLFMPLPRGRKEITVEGKSEAEYRKSLKKLAYAEVSLWNKIIAGNLLTIKTEQIQHGELLTATDEPIPDPKHPEIKPYKKQVMQRVTVPRDETNNTTPFFFEWLYFHPQCGLYCIVDVNDEKTYKEVVKLFKILGEVGIGTDRNVGGGKFEVEEGTISIDAPVDANAMMSLGLYLPTRTELGNINLDESRYMMLQRGGFMAGSSNSSLCHLRKRSIYMFDEGSVFSTKTSLQGKVEDLKPDWNTELHPVFRSGRTIMIPIKN